MTAPGKKSGGTPKIDKKTGAPRDAGTSAKMQRAHDRYSATEGKEATHDTPADQANRRK
jgi:hypothetical protein